MLQPSAAFRAGKTARLPAQRKTRKISVRTWRRRHPPVSFVGESKWFQPDRLPARLNPAMAAPQAVQSRPVCWHQDSAVGPREPPSSAGTSCQPRATAALRIPSMIMRPDRCRPKPWEIFLGDSCLRFVAARKNSAFENQGTLKPLASQLISGLPGSLPAGIAGLLTPSATTEVYLK